MRARNPWLRLRLMMLGWKVLFIGMPSGYRYVAGKGRESYCYRADKSIINTELREERLWITCGRRARLGRPAGLWVN